MLVLGKKCSFYTWLDEQIISVKHLQRTHLGFSEEELQVSATQNAVVLHIAGNVHSAGPVHGAVDLHVVVYGV